MSKGRVLELYVSVKDKDSRDIKEQIVLDEKGVIGDKFHGKNIQRSILITSKESYDLALQKGIEIPLGSLGENIMIDINPYSLTSGDKIQIGEALVEITNNCTICNGLSKVDSSLPDLLSDDRGIFAKTLNGGIIKKGDKVNIL